MKCAQMGRFDSVKWMGWMIGGAIAVTAYALAASAGTKDGGGGPSVVCNGPDGKVATAQLLDLYEAQIRYGLTTAESSAPAAQQLKTAFDRLAAYNWFLASDVEEALEKVESKVSFLPVGVIMAPGVDLGDSYAALIPDGCQLAYVGYYESDGTLRISQDIWNKLDQTSRAALFMHEALYMVAREVGMQKNSLDSREINGYLFSTAQSLSALDAVVPDLSWNSRFNDSTDSLKSILVPQASDTWSVDLTNNNGKPLDPSDSLEVECLVAGTVGWQFYDIHDPTLAKPHMTDPSFCYVGPNQQSSLKLQFPVGDCRVFNVNFYGPDRVTVTSMYGAQVLDTYVSPPGEGGTNTGTSYVSVYAQHMLVAPTNLPQ